MRKVKPLSTATSGYPLGDNSPNKRTGVDFLQLREDERFDAIMRLATNNGTTAYILTGTLTILGGNYIYSGGWVYYNFYNTDPTKMGELFYTPAVPLTSMGGNAYLNASVNEVPDLDDPVNYSDGAPKSPHLVRTVVFTPASSPSAGAVDGNGFITTLPDATTWITMVGNVQIMTDLVSITNALITLGGDISTINSEITTINSEITTINSEITALQTPIMRQLAVTNPASPGAFWADIDPALSYTTPSDGITRNYMIVAKVTVSSPILGAGNSAGADFRLFDGSTLDTTAWFVSTPVAYSQINAVSPITLCWVGSLPPGTTVSFQTTGANSLSLNSATLSIAQLGSPS